MARRTGVSHTTAHRIWKAHDLKPHRLETFKFITDPQAEERIHDVVGLYLNPPTNAVVLTLDQKTQVQALERTQPLLSVRPGLSAGHNDYRRMGVTSLYAAIEVASGKVVARCLHFTREAVSTREAPPAQASGGAARGHRHHDPGAAGPWHGAVPVNHTSGTEH